MVRTCILVIKYWSENERNVAHVCGERDEKKKMKKSFELNHIISRLIASYIFDVVEEIKFK